MKCILFSPVGKTDPITNYHDGSLIHISRKYRPEIIYLYISKEMYEYHQLDNRYRKCLEWLQEKEQFISSIHVIERPDLIDVQLFDYFYDEFDKELQQIHVIYPDYEILLNVSSGTPAMKSALQFLAAASECGYRAIQVSAPQKSANTEQYELANYDLELYWELNEDNGQNYVDRCSESATLMLNKRIKLEVIRKHIEAYDYRAALNVAKTIEKVIPEKLLYMLEGAQKRMALDTSGAVKAFNKTDISPMPNLGSDKAPIIEYMLGLQVKQQRGDLVDFIRGITPVIVDILELILKEKCNMNIHDFCEKNRKGIMCTNRQKLERNFPDLFYHLDEIYDEPIQNKPLSSHILVSIMDNKCDDLQLKNRAIKLREIEQGVRNTAAHEIVSVTEEFLVSKVEKNSTQILKLMKQLIQQGVSGIKSEVWNSYNDMNDMIIKEISKVV